jgi:hypothetical protein
MMNNCLELAEPESTQTLPDDDAGARQRSLAERFEEALAQCKAVAECLENLFWKDLPEREKTARLLDAMGSRSKATRYRDCHASGIPVDCTVSGERYFSKYCCTLRYCEFCGYWHFSRLMEKYREPVSKMIAEQPTQQGRTLAMLTFTVRAYDRIPEPDEARHLNKLVRRWFSRILPDDVVWGCIFAVETGHELAVKHPGREAQGWNLHVHVLYYGPYLNWSVGLELWKEVTVGDGQGFYIKQCPGWRKNPEQAVRRALVHHFGYIMKPAAVSAERIAALEALFSGIRRVHALGAFYHLPQSERRLVNPSCPKCGCDLPINLRAWHTSERVPVVDLEAEGRRDWRAVKREAGRGLVFGGRAP